MRTLGTLRAINLHGRNVMHGMYRPHGPHGKSVEGPQAVVHCDEPQRKQLMRWRQLILNSSGVSAYRSLSRNQLESPPSLFIVADSEAPR